MDKEAEFLKLVQDVSQCHLCANMVTMPHSMHGECLVNDDHGLPQSMPYVNLWNLWHGNLNADIMVIGQDFGQREDVEDCLSQWKSGEYKSQTDKALCRLFQKAFNIDVNQENEPLFFTNMANCYRKQKTTGSLHSGWLPICANKYMARLIEIIRPRIIIVLGQAAFEAMFCLENMPIQCIGDPDVVAKETLSDMMRHQYQLVLDDLSIKVFPVYHPGPYSRSNRSEDMQLRDWKSIAAYCKKGS
jgi:DNA polymerase